MTIAEFLDAPEGKIHRPAEWARRIGITRGYLNQLATHGKVPSLHVVMDIHRTTNGLVTPFDWGV